MPPVNLTKASYTFIDTPVGARAAGGINPLNVGGQNSFHLDTPILAAGQFPLIAPNWESLAEVRQSVSMWAKPILGTGVPVEVAVTLGARAVVTPNLNILASCFWKPGGVGLEYRLQYTDDGPTILIGTVTEVPASPDETVGLELYVDDLTAPDVHIVLRRSLNGAAFGVIFNERLAFASLHGTPGRWVVCTGGSEPTHDPTTDVMQVDDLVFGNTAPPVAPPP